MALNDTIATFVEDTTVAHEIIHGDANTTVETDNGPVRSLAKLIADSQEFVDTTFAGQASAANASAAEAIPDGAYRYVLAGGTITQ